MSATLDLAIELLERPSVTPDDAGCLDIISERLAACGFVLERMPFGEGDEHVDNLWARRGTASPTFVFAGHTDVVPTGPLEQWDSDPFTPDIRDGELYARGAADMKGSIAAMLVAIESFISEHDDHNGSIALLLTSDEEGPSINGTVKVVEALQARGESIDYCLVGEPSSTNTLGDVIKNGRRGSIRGWLTVHGVQGHEAYPHLADNPVHRALPVLASLTAREWDQGNEHFPPTTFQITEFNAGGTADNVIPGECKATLKWRFSTEQTAESIKEATHAVLDTAGIQYSIEWKLSGNPFLTAEGPLVNAAVEAIREVKGIETELSTSGGTSDGRFIAPTGAQVVELGPLNASIHKINEHVNVSDLNDLNKIYQKILENLLLQ